MSSPTISGTTICAVCAGIDGLNRQITQLTADNGSLRAQQHDLVRAKEAACADARLLRAELETTKNTLHTERARANRTGW